MLLNYRVQLLRLAVFTVCLCSLVACQKSEVRYSKSLDREALIRLPFPTWQASGVNTVQVVDLTTISSSGTFDRAVETRAVISPMYVVKFDDTHAVMVTETWPSIKGDEPLDCHACSGIIGAYFFENTPKGWRLSARQDAVAESGVNVDIGKTKITKLANGHFALTAQWGSTWQGYSGSWLVVVGLAADKATMLNQGIPASINNDGAWGACSELDRLVDIDAAAERHECLDIHSQWKFQGNSLLMTFVGRMSELDQEGKLLPTRKISQQAVYELKSNQLVLTKGENPIPGL